MNLFGFVHLGMAAVVSTQRSAKIGPRDTAT